MPHFQKLLFLTIAVVSLEWDSHPCSVPAPSLPCPAIQGQKPHSHFSLHSLWWLMGLRWHCCSVPCGDRAVIPEQPDGDRSFWKHQSVGALRSGEGLIKGSAVPRTSPCSGHKPLFVSLQVERDVMWGRGTQRKSFRSKTSHAARSTCGCSERGFPVCSYVTSSFSLF